MVVIGAGRVGTALKRRADARDLPCILLDRAAMGMRPAALQAANGDPILLAVRNDDLDELLSAIPNHRRHDLVFLQNGAIRGFLTDHGLIDASRGVLYLLAARRDDDLSAAGRSVFTGLHADRVARWFSALEIPAESTDRGRFSLFELEKLLWLSILGLLCDVSGRSVAAVAETQREQIAALVAELAPILRAAWGIDPDYGWLVDRIVAWSMALGDYRASVKEWRWRNGWLVNQARRYNLPTPLHDALLERRGAR